MWVASRTIDVELERVRGTFLDRVADGEDRSSDRLHIAALVHDRGRQGHEPVVARLKRPPRPTVELIQLFHRPDKAQTDSTLQRPLVPRRFPAAREALALLCRRWPSGPIGVPLLTVRVAICLRQPKLPGLKVGVPVFLTPSMGTIANVAPQLLSEVRSCMLVGGVPRLEVLAPVGLLAVPSMYGHGDEVVDFAGRVGLRHVPTALDKVGKPREGFLHRVVPRLRRGRHQRQADSLSGGHYRMPENIGGFRGLPRLVRVVQVVRLVEAEEEPRRRRGVLERIFHHLERVHDVVDGTYGRSKTLPLLGQQLFALELAFLGASTPLQPFVQIECAILSKPALVLLGSGGDPLPRDHGHELDVVLVHPRHLVRRGHLSAVAVQPRRVPCEGLQVLHSASCAAEDAHFSELAARGRRVDSAHNLGLGQADLQQRGRLRACLVVGRGCTGDGPHGNEHQRPHCSNVGKSPMRQYSRVPK
mmetsp:Transcript_10058/g.26728  ORF Transcript_10058/g.26728 Transcript_10058/m.26728 type:complete len:474 (-) Transcript_10058:13-1434(-)